MTDEKDGRVPTVRVVDVDDGECEKGCGERE